MLFWLVAVAERLITQDVCRGLCPKIVHSAILVHRRTSFWLCEEKRIHICQIAHCQVVHFLIASTLCVIVPFVADSRLRFDGRVMIASLGDLLKVNLLWLR